MIFINYRKDDTKQIVKHLCERLVSRYGKDQIFVDFEDIKPGETWSHRLKEELESRRVLLSVIGSKWGDVRVTQGDDEGRLRLDIEDDWVRQEICTAVRRAKDNKMLIIVVLVDNAKLPKTKWRCEIDELHALQNVMIRYPTDFDSDINRLWSGIEGQIPELKQIADLRSKVVEVSKSFSSEELSELVVHPYLLADLPDQALLKLPLVSPNGQPVFAPINELRIDLPLIITHEHIAHASKDKSKWIGANVSDIHNQIRDTHTNSLIVDRTSRIEDIQRDCNIGEKLGQGSRIVVIGDPGCGKSTLLQWLAFHYGSSFNNKTLDLNQSLPNRNWLPILILCREITTYSIPINIEELLHLHLKSRQLPDSLIEGSKLYFQKLLEDGQAILLIDGLDEIPNLENRLKFSKLLASIANRFQKSPIVVTSRVVGFQAVKTDLSLKFDHLLVCPLDWQAKQEFIGSWSKLLGWDAEKVSSLINMVCHNRDFAKLTENILLLAMVTQIQTIDHEMPTRRIDVYRLAVQMMIERRRPLSGPPLESNEILPHLECLAYYMRQKGMQRCSETEIIDLFHKLRLQEPEVVLRNRSSEELLSACLNSIGILHVAGNETDNKGFDRLVIEFSHQSFQEYFASQAIKHGLDGKEEVSAPGNGETNVIGRLHKILSKIEIRTREVNIWGTHNIIEPVIGDFWQETFRMLIADLEPNEANDAFQVLLPNIKTPAKEARPRAIFALQCLADEPKVSEETIMSVFDAVIDNLQEGDGYTTKLNTWMDEAIAAVSKSPFGIMLHDRFLQGYIENRGEKRNQIGCCLVLRLSDDATAINSDNANKIIALSIQGLESKKQFKRVDTALELMNRFFITNGKLGFLTSIQKTFFLESLMSAMSKDEATESAVIWALNWFSGAKLRIQNLTSDANSANEIIKLEAAIIRKIEDVLMRPKIDINTINLGVLILTRQSGLNIVLSQQDWIYNLARIADGAEPRKNLPSVKSTGRKETELDWLKNLLKSGLEEKYSCRIAQTLGSFGVFMPDMVKSLKFLFLNKKFPDEERDEALIYLALIGNLEVKHILIEAADMTEQEDEYLYGRGLFGLLLVDDVDILERQVLKALPHSDLNSYAYGLVGSNNARGVNIAKALKNHSNIKIKSAVSNAFSRPWAPNSWSWF